MARQRSHRSRRRRRGRFSGLYRFLAFLAVAAAVVVACVIFFRVNYIAVEGNSRYTGQEIAEASGIHTGDNLIALPKGTIASAIRKQLPYVETVSVKRKLPDGVILSVSERTAAATVEAYNGSWLISSRGKLLEQGEGDVPAVRGLIAQAPFAGSDMQVKEEQSATRDYVLAILSALEEKGMLAECGEIDCSHSTYITATWGIYTLKFPRGGDYPYMLRLVDAALADERMPQNEPGTFDLTVGDNAVHFKRAK